MTPSDAVVSAVEEAKDAVRQAIRDAESAAHDLAGPQQRRDADDSRNEAFDAIDRLASLCSERDGADGRAVAPPGGHLSTLREWQPASQRPTGGGETYLVANARGQVAPWIRGVIHNNVGSGWDWDYGEAITHWMPLHAPPEADRTSGDGATARTESPKEPT